MRLVASLLETPRPLLCTSQRQSIRISDSLADLVTLLNGGVIESTDHSDSVARLRVDIARSERTSAAFNVEWKSQSPIRLAFMLSSKQLKWNRQLGKRPREDYRGDRVSEKVDLYLGKRGCACLRSVSRPPSFS